jgi:pimeloyl-ACP methyl ester carboxylesterase
VVEGLHQSQIPRLGWAARVREQGEEAYSFVKQPDGYARPRLTGPGKRRPVLFVHGLLLDGEGSWAPIAQAMAARGDFDLRHPNWHFRVDGKWKDIRDLSSRELGAARFTDVVDFYVEQAEAIQRETGQLPIVIGHSLGAVIAERVSASRRAEALVQIAPAPHSGVLPYHASGYRLLTDALKSKLLRDGAVYYTPAQFEQSFVGREAALRRVDGQRLYREHGLPLPGRVLLDIAALAPPDVTDPTPRFIFNGSQDTVTPSEIGRKMAQQAAVNNPGRVDYILMDGVEIGMRHGTNHGTILADLGETQAVPRRIVEWLVAIGR